jgi:uncharacterized protein with PhoU and TrkA domain
VVYFHQLRHHPYDHQPGHPAGTESESWPLDILTNFGRIQRLAKGSEATLIVALMLVSSLLSALINTVTVAAIFDFTPITAAIVVAGIAFMVLIGRHLLPSSSPGADDGSRPALGTSYQLDTNIFTAGIPKGSPLDGRTLAESRLGSALYLTVLALQRKGVLILAPRPNDILQSGDTLIVHGSPNHLQRIHAGQHLQVESPDLVRGLLSKCLYVAEGIVTEGSPLLGSTLAESALRREHRVNVLHAFTERKGAGRRSTCDAGFTP